MLIDKASHANFLLEAREILRAITGTTSIFRKWFNPLKTKRRLLYLKTQFVPRCKHFSSRL